MSLEVVSNPRACSVNPSRMHKLHEALTKLSHHNPHIDFWPFENRSVYSSEFLSALSISETISFCKFLIEQKKDFHLLHNIFLIYSSINRHRLTSIHVVQLLNWWFLPKRKKSLTMELKIEHNKIGLNLFFSYRLWHIELHFPQWFIRTLIKLLCFGFFRLIYNSKWFTRRFERWHFCRRKSRDVRLWR